MVGGQAVVRDICTIYKLLKAQKLNVKKILTALGYDSLSSSHLLDGIEIDYADRLGGGFKINNPNAASTCGCGESLLEEVLNALSL